MNFIAENGIVVATCDVVSDVVDGDSLMSVRSTSPPHVPIASSVWCRFGEITSHGRGALVFEGKNKLDFDAQRPERGGKLIKRLFLGVAAPTETERRLILLG